MQACEEAGERERVAEQPHAAVERRFGQPKGVRAEVRAEGRQRRRHVKRGTQPMTWQGPLCKLRGACSPDFPAIRRAHMLQHGPSLANAPSLPNASPTRDTSSAASEAHLTLESRYTHRQAVGVAMPLGRSNAMRVQLLVGREQLGAQQRGGGAVLVAGSVA